MILKDVATQVAGMMLHQATIEKFVAVLRDALTKAEFISTSRNGGSNKNVSWNACGSVCYTEQFFVQLVSQRNCETLLQEKLPSVT